MPLFAVMVMTVATGGVVNVLESDKGGATPTAQQ